MLKISNQMVARKEEDTHHSIDTSESINVERSASGPRRESDDTRTKGTR
jgi:hypothetical protein